MKSTSGSPAGESNNGGCIKIIDGDGKFDDHSCQEFQTDVKLADYKRSYAVVSTIGPQSVGKSTLLNRLFGTTFAEMDVLKGRSKTTHGIWLQKADITEPCILVMDLEGTDGQEKQDDTKFENQSAVFALLTSDVVLVNMSYQVLGLRNSANWPLFETVFQAVVRSFCPRKTTLVFVIHDKEDVNVEWAKNKPKKDIEEIWNSFSKPKAHERTPFSAFYDVEVFLLPHFRYQHQEFEDEVARLRQWFHDSIAPGVLAGVRQAEVDGSSFSYNAQQLWHKIKNNEDLDLPALRDMVAKARCEQIAEKQFNYFDKSELDKLCKDVRTQTISGFGKRLSDMIKECLLKYDEEATYFDRDVQFKKRKQLEEKLVQLVHPTYLSMLRGIKSESLRYFKAEFDKVLFVGGEKFVEVARECANCVITQFGEKCRDARIDQANWNESVEVLGQLQSDMSAHILKEKQLQMSSDQDRKDKYNQMLIKGSFVAQLLMLGMEIAIFKTPILSLRQPLLKAAILQQLAAAAAGTAAIGAADGKRTMDEVADWIVELLNVPSSVPGENQLDV